MYQYIYIPYTSIPYISIIVNYTIFKKPMTAIVHSPYSSCFGAENKHQRNNIKTSLHFYQFISFNLGFRSRMNLSSGRNLQLQEIFILNINIKYIIYFNMFARYRSIVMLVLFIFEK